MLEAVKEYGNALKYASAALKDDREFMLEAVKQYGCALRFASAGLRNGGLREYLHHLKSNVFNVPKQIFIATILGTRQRRQFQVRLVISVTPL